jgi:phage FluMu protein Com
VRKKIENKIPVRCEFCKKLFFYVIKFYGLQIIIEIKCSRCKKLNQIKLDKIENISHTKIGGKEFHRESKSTV